MNGVHLLCEYCMVVVHKNNYALHVRKVHDVKLPPNYDYNKKILEDSDKLAQYRAQVAEKEKQKLQKEFLKDTINKKIAAQPKTEAKTQKIPPQSQSNPPKSQKPPIDFLSVLHFNRKLSQEQEFILQKRRQKHIEENAIHYYFTWDDFEFDKNVIKLKSSRYKQIFKPISLKGSLGILNQIKNEYFNRLFPRPIKLFFFDNDFQEWLSKDWEAIKNSIEGAIEYANFKLIKTSSKPKFGSLAHLTPYQVIELFGDRLAKSVYLKCLAEKQDRNIKIIPILEYQNGQLEESFLFRLRTKSDRILIVWENSKEGRASHLFLTDESSMSNKLIAIESFIINTAGSKRIMLHESSPSANKLKRDMSYVDFIKHTTLASFSNELDNYIKTN